MAYAALAVASHSCLARWPVSSCRLCRRPVADVSAARHLARARPNRLFKRTALDGGSNANVDMASLCQEVARFPLQLQF